MAATDDVQSTMPTSASRRDCQETRQERARDLRRMWWIRRDGDDARIEAAEKRGDELEAGWIETTARGRRDAARDRRASRRWRALRPSSAAQVSVSPGSSPSTRKV
jgi:hypothetical protein